MAFHPTPWRKRISRHGNRKKGALAGWLRKKKLSRFSVASVCIFVPVLVICFIIARNMTGQLVRDEHALVRQRLENGVYSLVSRYENYQQSALGLLENTQLSPRVMLKNGFDALNGIRVLTTVNQANGASYDVFLYYGEGKLYSSQRLFGMEAYFERLLMCDGESAARGKALVSADQAGVCPLYCGRNTYFMLHIPWNAASANFVIAMDQLPEVMKLSVADCATYLRFALPDGQEVWFQGQAGQKLSCMGRQIPPVDRRQYTVLRDTGGPYGVTIELMYRTDEVFGKVRQVMTAHYLLIALGAVLSLGAAWMFSRGHWRRIRQLGTGQGVRPNRWFEDEYAYIQGVMDRQSHASVSQIKAQHTLVRSQAMTMLLHGLWHDRGSLQQCGIELSEEYYCVGSVLCALDGQQMQALIQQAGMLPAQEQGETGQAAVFFLMEIPNEDESAALRKERAGRLMQLVESAQGGPCCIVLSQVYQHLSIAGYAFTEAQSLLERAQVRDSKKSFALCWEETASTTQNVVRLDQDDLDAFLAALERRSQQKALALLQKLTNFIVTRAPTEENRCYLRYCLLQPILWAIGRSEYDEDTALIERFGHLDMADGQRFLGDVSRIVQSYCANLPSENRMDKALDYVRQNFRRYDLSLEEVADQVGISKSYMSNIFKQRTGMRYIDFLTQLRMEEAKRLLVETDLPVSTIFEQVGYLYKNSYSAKCKSYLGMNASEYRKLYRRQGEGEEDKGE